MISLLRKELRQLLPYLILFLGLELLHWVTQVFTVRLDEQSWTALCEDYCVPGRSPVVAMSYLIMTVFVAYGLFPREHNDRTIDYLRSLPVSRIQIFSSKILAALLLMVGFSVLAYVVNMSVLLINPGSMSGTLYPGVIGMLLVRDAIATFVFLSIGVLFSYLRGIGVVLLFLLFVAFQYVETRMAVSGPWSFLSMFEVQYYGTSLRLPWMALLVQFAIGSVALLLAYRLWSRADSKTQSAEGRRNGKRWKSALGIAAGMFFAAMFGLGTMISGERADGEGDGVERSNTEHFRFIYAQRHEARAGRLRSRADEIYRGVMGEISAQTAPTIRANLMTSSEHFAGRANWKSLKIDLSRSETAENFDYVLAHEVVHVFQATESKRQMRDHYESIRFFIEGSAEHIASRVEPDDGRDRRSEVHAAVAMKRLNIDFDDLVSDGEFIERFAPDLYYTIGALWSRALAEVCGDAIIGDVYRAFGRDGAPKSISGRTLWQDVLKSVDCEIEDVNSRFKRLARDVHQAYEASEPLWPEFADITAKNDGSGIVVIRTQFKNDADSDKDWPGRFSIRIQRKAGFGKEPDAFFTGRRVQSKAVNELADVEFRIPASALPKGRFKYQLGYKNPGDDFGMFGKWLPGAVAR